MNVLEKLLCFVVVLALTAFFGHRAGFNEAKRVYEAQWQQEKQGYLLAEIEARKQHAEKLAELGKIHQQTNLKNTTEHEKALKKVHADLAAARAESKRLGGLRIPAPVTSCPGTGFKQGTAGTQTTGAGPHYEEAAATIALPEAIEDSLWSTVGQADEVLEQARSCQAWIIDNGFYEKNPAVPVAD